RRRRAMRSTWSGRWRNPTHPAYGTSRTSSVFCCGADARLLAAGFALVSAGLAAVGKYAATYLPEGALHVASMLISFVVVMALFAMMFKWLPDVSVPWRGRC